MAWRFHFPIRNYDFKEHGEQHLGDKETRLFLPSLLARQSRRMSEQDGLPMSTVGKLSNSKLLYPFKLKSYQKSYHGKAVNIEQATPVRPGRKICKIQYKSLQYTAR